MDRRKFMTASGLSGMGLFLNSQSFSHNPGKNRDDRSYTVDVMLRIAQPILESLSRNELKKNMPVEAREGMKENRSKVTYLEAFGRLLAGISPWLELGGSGSEEGRQREKYISLTLTSLENSVDPKAPDFMNFFGNNQALVDAAFLAHGLLRSENILLGNLSGNLKKNLVNALKSTRVIKPPYNNWLLFAAMVEVLLMKLDEDPDRMRIDYAVKKHLEWYKGDGWYGDGPDFHWDYYNSFVIQPMLLDTLKVLVENGFEKEELLNQTLERARRHAVIQERLISPEATYPPIGRSLAYRFGTFQVLSQMALEGHLPDELPAAQVRSALTAVIKRQIEMPGTFDKDGWLQIGFAGHQPGIGEGYISTGSLYLCAVGLLHLGIHPDNKFWTDPSMDWTSKKAWNGEPIPIDHAI